MSASFSKLLAKSTPFKNLYLVSLVFIVFLYAGCASVPAGKTLVIHREQMPEMSPDNNSAVVTFYREGRFLVSAGLPFSLRESGQTIGVLENGTYFSVRTTHGNHTYTVEAFAKPSESITIIAKPNATTYIEVNFFAWGLRQFFSLKEIPPVTAKAAIQSLKYTELKPKGQTEQNHAYTVH